MPQLLLWPMVAIVLAALLWYVMLSKIAAEKAELNSEALRSASAYATLYAKQLTHLIESADQTTRLMKYHLEQSRGSMNTADLARQGIFPIAKCQSVIIADRNGDKIVRSNPGSLGNIADRDYFIHHKNSKSDMMLVGTPETKLSNGKGALHFTRRLDTPDGKFDGVVMLSVQSSYFSDFFTGAHIVKGGFLAMAALDGAQNMAIVAGHSPALPLLTSIPLFTVPEGTRILMGAPWFADNSPRLIAWHRLGAYPYVAMVGQDAHEFPANAQKIWERYRNEALAGSILLCIFAFVVTGLTARLALRKAQFERIKQDYGIATEDGNEAYYLFRALRDKNGAVIDFEIMDCNERGAAVYGENKTRLLGKKLSVACDDSFLDDLMETFRTVTEIGFHEDEYRVRPHSRLQMAWLRRKMVRTHNGLVLIMTDISEAKAYEENMRRLAARLTTTLESITDAFLTLDRQWRFTYINKEAEILMRRTHEDLFGKVIWDELKGAGSDERAIYREFHRALRENIAVEFEELILSTKQWLNVRAYPSDEGLAVYVRDISARKNAEQKILSSQAELRMLYDRLQNIREEERVALAREVHDQLGQILSAAKIDIKLLEDDIRPDNVRLSRRKISTELRSARLAIDKAIQSVRTIATELRPSELEDHGLLAAIKWHARDFERRTRVKCVIATPDGLREPEGWVAVALFRIFQEAMTNIMRHANASEVCVSLEHRAGMILMRVKDNGIGIAPAVARNCNSMGLKGMRERAAIVKGRVMVCALRPRGTLVSVRIPMIAEFNEFVHSQDWSKFSHVGDMA